MDATKRIVAYVNKRPTWLLELNENNILSCKMPNGTSTRLHEYSVEDFDADVDADGQLHLIVYSSKGLLLHFILNEQNTRVNTLSRVQPSTQRLGGLRIFTHGRNIDVFYTVCALPYSTATLAHYRNNGSWFGRRVFELGSESKSTLLAADYTDIYHFYSTQASAEGYCLVRHDYDPDQKTVTEKTLFHASAAITNLNVCNEHYAFGCNGFVYCDNELLGEGTQPMVMITDTVYCLFRRAGRLVVLCNSGDAWKTVNEEVANATCAVRGYSPAACTMSPYYGFPSTRLPLPEFTTSPEVARKPMPEDEAYRIQSLEEQSYNYGRAIFQLEAEVKRLTFELEQLRNKPKVLPEKAPPDACSTNSRCMSKSPDTHPEV